MGGSVEEISPAHAGGPVLIFGPCRVLSLSVLRHTLAQFKQH